MEIQPVTLDGQIIRLEPLSVKHVPDLALVGLEEEIWRFMVYGKMLSEADMLAWVEDLLVGQDRGTDLPFAVIHLETGRAVGATRYLDISRQDRRVEIGGTWYGLDYQGTGVNIDAKYLLLKHAFEVLGCLRVQLKTDARNIRSQRAIEKLGALKEGVLRKHMLLGDGYVRDSVMYSIIDSEWPAVKSRLEENLRALMISKE